MMRMVAGALMAITLTFGGVTGVRAQGVDKIEALNRQVVQLYQQGKYPEATALAEQALTLAERVLRKKHPLTLASVNNLAMLYRAQGRYGEAKPLYQHALAVRERVLGEDHPDTFTSVNDLAVLYWSQGHYGEAEPLFKRALKGFERVLGKEHPKVLTTVNNLASLYGAQGRHGEAEPLFKRALEVRKRVLGEEHPDTLASASNLAGHYTFQGRHGEAEPLFKRALEAQERVLGKGHPDTLASVHNLALLYRDQSRYSEAESHFRRALKARERVLGKEHPDTLVSVHNLASLYRDQGRYGEAEPLFERALKGFERTLGREHPNTLTNISNLALLYRDHGHYDEAEPLFKRALEAQERVLGVDHPLTLTNINNLALLYQDQGRYDEAEPLFRRALEKFERMLGREHSHTLTSVNNLAGLYTFQGRYGEAVPLLKRALDTQERVLGKEHRDTLTSVNNLAFLYQSQGRFGEAEPLFRRALEASERVFGKEHPDTLGSVNNLAELYRVQVRYGEAEPLYKRALKGFERVLGRKHPDVAVSVTNFASLRFAQGNWAGAIRFWRRSTDVIVERLRRGANDVGEALTGKKQGEAERKSFQFRALVKAASRVAEARPSVDTELIRETFQTAQWALGSEAARSLAQMAARGAKGDPNLAAMVRERQDLLGEWQALDRWRNAALARPAEQRHSEAEAANLARLGAIEARIAEIDKELAADFPDYAAFASPEPLSVTQVQSWLGADEALVLFLDTPEVLPAEEETFIWVVTKMEAKWLRTASGTATLIQEIQALRCGLDEEEWALPTRARRCASLLGLTELPDKGRPLPFHLGKAHDLYRALFGQAEYMIADKRLLIVPAGPLTSLPFQALVTRPPSEPLPESFEAYRDVAWLGRRNAIAILPAVSSLSALRQWADSDGHAASRAYAGYGDPVLRGNGGCRMPAVPGTCSSADLRRVGTAPGGAGRATVRGRGGRRSADLEQVFDKGAVTEAVLERVRQLCPLPDTAHEIRCVAEGFPEDARLIRLGSDAREADLKALSTGGELARYRIVHFATHGLLSGDVQQIAKRQGEPALVLTPPEVPADGDDDGLLTASEVAALKFNADWVVLSACNTAAGEELGAEALSGLARAFFYAGGRTLLVSHWPVYSNAAVRLTTHAFAELDRDPKTGRAEALQRAMVALMDDDSQSDNAHPAVWAPFVVVGEGGRR